MTELANLRQAVINFYSDTYTPVEDLTEIPTEALTTLIVIPYNILITHRVLSDRHKVRSLRALAARYNVGVRVIRTIVS